MLGPTLYDKYPTGARPKPGKDAIVSKFALFYEKYGLKKKAAHGSSHVAFTPFPIARVCGG
jgi:hypothetical protein